MKEKPIVKIVNNTVSSVAIRIKRRLSQLTFQQGLSKKNVLVTYCERQNAPEVMTTASLGTVIIELELDQVG